MRETQKEKLLTVWVGLQSRNLEKFFYPYEFIGEGPTFIGYKAPARFSELCVAYPEMIESRMEGKYRIGRLRFDNAQEFLEKLPENLASLMKELMQSNSVRYPHEEIVRRYDSTTNTVIMTKQLVQ